MKKSGILIFLLSGILFFSCNQKNKESDYVKKVALNEETIAVGIYKAKNIEYQEVSYISEATKIDLGIVYVTLTDSNLFKTRLDNIDVLVLPQLKNGKDIDKLDAHAAEIIKEFVTHKGKKIITFGNGGLLLSSNEGPESLGLVEVKFEKDSANSLSSGIIECYLTSQSENIFPELADGKTFFIRRKAEWFISSTDTSTTEVLIKETKYPLIVSANSGKGKVLMINASPETTPGMRWIIPRLIRWIENKDFVWYNENVVKPERYSEPVIVDAALKSQINGLLKQLDAENKKEIIAAMDNLHRIYPWVGAEKVRSLLVEKSDDIKLRAAEYLVDIEYTLALEDIEQVIKKERRRKVKEQLVAYKQQLEKMLEQN